MSEPITAVKSGLLYMLYSCRVVLLSKEEFAPHAIKIRLDLLDGCAI